jgi:hypothetical protein
MDCIAALAIGNLGSHSKLVGSSWNYFQAQAIIASSDLPLPDGSEGYLIWQFGTWNTVMEII